MALIIGDSICRREFGGSLPEADKQVLLRAAKPALGISIKGENLPKGTRLLKTYATSPQGARRVVFLMQVAKGDLFLLFYRDKKDAVGANVTIKNPAFRKQLHQHLEALVEDIQSKNFQTFEI